MKFKPFKQYKLTPDKCKDHKWVKNEIEEGLYSADMKLEKSHTCEICGLTREWITKKIKNPRTQGVIKS